MKCKLSQLVKELGTTPEGLLEKLVWLGKDEIELSIRELSELQRHKEAMAACASRQASVVPCEHRKEPDGHLLSIMAAARCLGIGRGSLTTAVKKKLAVPVKTSVGPKRRCMHYFSEEQIQALQAQQKVLIDTGYRCPQELANEFGVIVDDIARALRGMPAARDSYLLRRKGTPGYAKPVSYYHPKSWAGIVKKEVAASA